ELAAGQIQAAGSKIVFVLRHRLGSADKLSFNDTNLAFDRRGNGRLGSGCGGRLTALRQRIYGKQPRQAQTKCSQVVHRFSSYCRFFYSVTIARARGDQLGRCSSPASGPARPSRRCQGASSNPAASAAAAVVRVNGTLSADATAPQSVLPSANPPCNTSTYMEITRARTQAGAAVCAETFRVARVLIQARPAAAEKLEATTSVLARTSPHRATAKTSVAPAMTASGEKRLRARGNTPAPASAPVPKKASMAPKPSGPNLRAISGSKAQNELAKSENTRVRTSTVRIRGSWRA